MLDRLHRSSPPIARCAALAATGAALCLASPAFAQGAGIDEATAEQKSAAKEAYIAGRQALEAEQLEQALEHFRESYDTVASPNSHLLIARSMAELGRNVAAYREYTRVIDEAEAAAEKHDKYDKTAQAARNERTELKTRVGFVEVELDAAVTVADRPIPFERWGEPVVVEPGSVPVTVRSPSGATRRVELEVAAGATETATLAPPEKKPPPPPPPPPPGIDQRTLAYVSGGIGAAGLVTFAVFGALNNARFDDLEERCEGGICPASLADDAETGRTYQAVAKAGLGVGIAGLGAGLALFFTAPETQPGAQEKTASAAGGSKAPRLGIGPRSVTVRGRF